ncbi:hypothetical protein [Nibribacter koreensis]|uniref:Uncharacterized protein n=1 Tax=Nibribacter koreensis TaxID=1084519 RepID=A0ABP8F7U5_9BACT
MKTNSEVYSLSKGYGPSIYKSETGLIYCFPVSSGHADLTFEFGISEQDLDILKSSQYRFKALFYILFQEAQSTFGTGHPNPRRYTVVEFENAKNKVLYNSEKDLQLYIKEFSKRWNLGENYFQYFSSNVY